MPLWLPSLLSVHTRRALTWQFRFEKGFKCQPTIPIFDFASCASRTIKLFGLMRNQKQLKFNHLVSCRLSLIFWHLQVLWKGSRSSASWPLVCCSPSPNKALSASATVTLMAGTVRDNDCDLYTGEWWWWWEELTMASCGVMRSPPSSGKSSSFRPYNTRSEKYFNHFAPRG